MVDPREDELDLLPLPDSSDAPRSLVDRLKSQLGVRDGHIESAARGGMPLVETPPVMVGRFEILRSVGKGGMGVVFEAFDTELRRRVALKVWGMNDDDVEAAARAGESPVDVAAAIEQEARALAKLAHPNIVAVYEILRLGSDVVLVMEFIDGLTLHAWQATTRPSVQAVLDRYVDAGWALEAIHAAGLTHGDFKPKNVMIDHLGRVRVIDFGLARHSSVPKKTSKTGAVEFPGTRPYMPPELLTGKPLMQRPGCPLADIFSFSVSAWESIHGVRPYAGETVPAVLASIEAGKFQTGMVAGAVVPDAVRNVLKRGLHADPSERPQSMEELLDALADARASVVVGRARWRRRVEVGLRAALVVACMVMAAMLIWEPEISEVDQALALAESSADDRDGPGVVKLLEVAASRARQNSDREAMIRVAGEAERFGERLFRQGDSVRAWECWAVAADIYLELHDWKSYHRVHETDEQ